MTILKVERVQNHYRRTRNGAWVGGGQTSDVFEAEDQELRLFGIGNGITVTWPDGVEERAYPGGNGVAGYPPHCVPHDGRLSQLLKS